jgi:hypothetical protein
MDIAHTTGQTTKRFRTKQELIERVTLMENGATYEQAFAGEEFGDTWNRLLDENVTPTMENVVHPSHYNQYNGFEVIDVCEQLVGPDGRAGFNLGNAFKYIARAGWKNPETHVEDLEKAKFYLQREIDRVDKVVTVEGQALAKEDPSEEMPVHRCPVCSLRLQSVYKDDVTLFCMNNHGSMYFGPGSATGVWNPKPVHDESSNTPHETESRVYAVVHCPVCEIVLDQDSVIPNLFYCPDNHGTMRFTKFLPIKGMG